MFKKLKEKIAEEVKPLKIPQFAQSVVSPVNNTLVDVPPPESFSLDDDLPEDLLGNEGFSVVDLHHPSQPLSLSSGRFSRQSSMSSLASDASAFLPIHDASLGAFNMQDLESASEREDVLPQMNSVSKQELCNSYLKLYRHYQKYKGRAADLKTFCRELEKDNRKHKTVLLECQEKSLRRMAELKEQCALEQHAKAHLEEALRNDLEEKDHLIQTLQTKIKLLKDAQSVNSSLTHAEDDNVHNLPGESYENVGISLFTKCDLQSHQEQQTEPLQVIDSQWKHLFEEDDANAFKKRVEYFKQQMLVESSTEILDTPLKTQLLDFLNEMSSSLSGKVECTLVSCSKDNEMSELEIHNNHEKEVAHLTSPEISDKSPRNLMEVEREVSYEPGMSNESNLQNIHSYVQNANDLSQQIICEKSDSSVNTNQSESPLKTCSCQNTTEGYLSKVEKELSIAKDNFDNLMNSFQNSQEVISEQESTLKGLHEEITHLRGEAEEASSQKKKITDTVEALKCELVQTKLQVEEFQQQILAAQSTIEMKDQNTKKMKNDLVEINEELNKACSEKSEMSQLIVNLETELTDTRHTCEQMTHEMKSSKEIIKEKESTIECINRDLNQTREELVLAYAQRNKANEDIAGLEKELKETKLKFQQKNNEFECISKETLEKDSVIKFLHQDMETLLSQKDEALQMVTFLQTELKDSKVLFDDMSNQFQSAVEQVKEKDKQVTEVNNKLAVMQQTLETLSKDANEKVTITTCLQSELDNTNLHFSDISGKLQSALEQIKEKELQLTVVNNKLALLHQELETVSKEKIEVNEKVATLENEVVSAKLLIEQVTQDLQSAHESMDKKDSEIGELQNELTSVRTELDTTLLQAVKKNEMVQSLQNELLEAKSQIQQLTQNLVSAHKLAEQKDSERDEVRAKLANVQKELHELSSHEVENSKIVSDLQKELMKVNVQFEKVNKELQLSCVIISEKDVTIASVNEDLAAVQKKLEAAVSKNLEANNEVGMLERKVMDMSVCFEQMMENLDSAQKLVCEKDSCFERVSDELSGCREELDKVESEKTEALNKITTLQNELSNVNISVRDTITELEAAHKLIEEKDSNIACLTADVANARKLADTSSVEKQTTIEEMTSFQSELANTKYEFEQVNQQLQSAYQVAKERDITITRLTDELTNVHKELDSATIQNTEICTTMKDLQHELKDVKLNSELKTKEIQASHQLIEEKNCNIAHLSEDLGQIREELNSISALKSEKCEVVTVLERELQDSRNLCDKLGHDLESANKLLEEKNNSVEQLHGDLVRIKEELDLTSTQKTQASENAINLQHELNETMLRLEKVTQDLLSTQKLLEDKKLADDCISNASHPNSTAIDRDETLVTTLQSELMITKSELEKLLQELQCAQKIIEEKDSNITIMRNELTYMYKNSDIPFHPSDINNVNTTLENKFLDSAFHSRSLEHCPDSSLSISQVDVSNAIAGSKGQLCVNCNEKLCNKSFKSESSGDSYEKTEFDRRVGSELSEMDSNTHKRKRNEQQEECSVVECETYPSPDDKVLNSSQISPSSERLMSVDKILMLGRSETSEEGSSALQNNKKTGEDDMEILSQSVQELQIIKEAARRNISGPLLGLDSGDAHEKNSLQFTYIENILEEIQKENIEYGSLLESHKNIINHLVKIAKLHTKDIQPGSAELLHNQLVLLSQKLYDTKEKQRIQIAAMDKFIKHQKDLVNSGINENDMTIEMQYLRNIVFQYMIGKETMLLSKVISAVMKFDEQQMDQVMQKEHQKQTLFGQLGLL